MDSLFEAFVSLEKLHLGILLRITKYFPSETDIFFVRYDGFLKVYINICIHTFVDIRSIYIYKYLYTKNPTTY